MLGFEKIYQQVLNFYAKKIAISKSEKLYRYNYYILKKDYWSAFKNHPIIYMKNVGRVDRRLIMNGRK